MGFPILAALVLLPAVGALVIGLIPSHRRDLLLPVAVGISTLPLALVGYLIWEFATADAAFQFTQRLVWFESWDAGWNVGVDGISLFLLALTALLFPLSLLASVSITDRVKTYLIAMLILETGLLGAFVALDLLLFFAFFEITLVPMFLLIGIWGSGNRVYAATQVLPVHGARVGVPARRHHRARRHRQATNSAGSPSTSASCSPSTCRRKPSSGSSWRLRRHLPSRCRCSRSTPGCQTPTPRRPRQVRCCSPACC